MAGAELAPAQNPLNPFPVSAAPAQPDSEGSPQHVFYLLLRKASAFCCFILNTAEARYVELPGSAMPDGLSSEIWARFLERRRFFFEKDQQVIEVALRLTNAFAEPWLQ